MIPLGTLRYGYHHYCRTTAAAAVIIIIIFVQWLYSYSECPHCGGNEPGFPQHLSLGRRCAAYFLAKKEALLLPLLYFSIIAIGKNVDAFAI